MYSGWVGTAGGVISLSESICGWLGAGGSRGETWFRCCT